MCRAGCRSGGRVYGYGYDDGRARGRIDRKLTKIVWNDRDLHVGRGWGSEVCWQSDIPTDIICG